MKSTFGLALAAGVLLAFALAWRLATHDGAGLLDQQWLFFTALPFNLVIVSVFGDSDFSPDAPGQVIAAAASEAAVAYFAGAVAQFVVRSLWRFARPRNGTR